MRLMRWVVCLLGLWQLSAPYALHYSSHAAAAADVILGGLVALCGLYGATSGASWTFRITSLLGIAVLVLPFVHPGDPRATEHVISGALILLASLLAWTPSRMRV